MEKTSTEIKDFVSQSYGIVDQLQRSLTSPPADGGPEKGFSDSHSAMRTLRKAGASRGLKKLESLAQTGEVILGRLDQGQIYLQPQIFGFLLNRVEDIRQEISRIEASGMDTRLLPAPTRDGVLSASFAAVQSLPLNPLPWLQKTLIFRTPDDGRMAIPFDNVMRLESFTEPKAGENIREGASDRWMPLVDVSRMLTERRLVFRRPPVRVPAGQTRQVIVYVTPQGEVGLVVDAILDVLRAKLEVQRPAVRSGVLGSMELKDRVTELLNVPALLAQSGLKFVSAAVTPGQDERIAG
jgi:chemotaxis protein histidine kinase CheA